MAPLKSVRLRGQLRERIRLGHPAEMGKAEVVLSRYEVAAVLGSANATLVSGYGYAGILVSFIARHNPLAIIPVAILIGGIGAAGSLLQRRMGLPDAAMLVLQGMAFMFILGMETMTGRLKFFQPRGN
jgi:simple sugar transport system permease protein